MRQALAGALLLLIAQASAIKWNPCNNENELAMVNKPLALTVVSAVTLYRQIYQEANRTVHFSKEKQLSNIYNRPMPLASAIACLLLTSWHGICNPG